MFWFAVSAGPMKNQFMCFNVMSTGQQRFVVQLFIIGQIQIKYPTADLTAEVRMGLYIGVRPLHRKSHPYRSALIHQ